MRNKFFYVVALSTGLMLPLAVAEAQSVLPVERSYGAIEQVFSFRGEMPTGVTVSSSGRIFICFPRWGDDVPYTVGEIRNGDVVPYPDLDINHAHDGDPVHSFINVQSVVADDQDRLWVLDTAAPGFSTPIAGGAKLVAVDLKTNKIMQTIVFPANVILKSTYVNDVRIDFRVGRAGVAYITDSSGTGPGAIIVVDLSTGTALRRLNGDSSTSPERGFIGVVEGRSFGTKDANGTFHPAAMSADGIALSPDGKTLYYSPLSSRHLFAVPTGLLRDPNVPERDLAAAVQDLGEKGASDGLAVDATGAVYAGDYEHNGIRRRTATGYWETLVHDPRVLWPDTLSIGPDGYLYFTVNQLNRMPPFNDGQDLRQKPYSLFRLKIDAGPAPMR
jgi:sugar lactone lactonase YvrE